MLLLVLHVSYPRPPPLPPLWPQLAPPGDVSEWLTSQPTQRKPNGQAARILLSLLHRLLFFTSTLFLASIHVRVLVVVLVVVLAVHTRHVRLPVDDVINDSEKTALSPQTSNAPQ